MNKNRTLKTMLAMLMAFMISTPSMAEVVLPRFICDGMVLQRNTTARIWGKASPGEKVTVRFLKKRYVTTADKDGLNGTKMAAKITVINSTGAGVEKAADAAAKLSPSA